MHEIANTDESAPFAAVLPYVELGKWLGRRDAFGRMARRCSAAEIESLREIHDGKQYQLLNCTWEEFCARYLNVSPRTVEREIVNLRRFGPAFFAVRQLSRITSRQYAAIADCITEEGIHLNGELIALDSGNDDQVARAVKALLEQHEPAETHPAPTRFDTALRRFRTAVEVLCAFEGELDPIRASEVAMELGKLLSAAAGWGLQIRA